MSYIGKNPKVDSVKLEASEAAASGTAEGQIYYNTGTGSISKGLKVFKNNQFVSVDKQLGDADTFHLLKASDISTAEFSAARNSTSTSFLNQNAVPFETTTASGAAGTFSNSSTGDALLTDESADLVFAYKSSGTSDDAQEYFGIPLTVPKAFRGGNVVLTFQYRTGFGTGTTATVDGDFEVAVLDKSTGNGGQTTTTATSGTAISAGSNIAVASKTGLAVGQRIRLETGSSTIAAGSPDATVTEAFITSISTSTDHITISKDYAPPSTSGGRITSGWLTDVVPGQLPAADSQTNKQGKKFSIQFKTEDDTSDIVLFFQNKNTSSTISRHLFVDNILLSANKFLQASSQFKSEQFLINTWDGRAGNSVYSDATPTKNTMDKLGTVTNSSTQGFFFTAKQKCKVSFDFMMQSGGTPDIGIAGGSSTLDFFNNNLQSTHFDGFRLSAQAAQTATGNESISAEIVLEKNEKVGVVWSDSTSTVNTGNNAGSAIIVATSEVSDTILLESQDEIFEDWTEYTPSITGSTVSDVKFHYRRTGGNLDIRGTYLINTIGTGTDAAPGSFTLPSGFKLDTSQLVSQKSVLGRGFYIDNGFYITVDARGWVMTYFSGGTAPAGDSAVYFAARASTTSQLEIDNLSGVLGDNNRQFSIFCSVPVVGFNSNFNPLLSMPLQDFSSIENTFSARIANNGTAATVTSQSGNFIASVSRPTNGVVNVTFVTGFFSIAPAVNATVENTSNSDRTINVYSVSATGFSCSIEAPTDFGFRDNDFNVVVTRQGSDFRQAPLATAAVIKPAVAIIEDRKSAGTLGGTSGTTGSFHDRTLNTFKGETWFVTPGTGTIGVGGTCASFTLQAGTYEVDAVSPFMNTNGTTLKLVDSTDSTNIIDLGLSQPYYVSATAGATGTPNLNCTFTLTSSALIKLQYRPGNVNSTNDLGAGNNYGVDEVYSRVVVKKLK